METEIVQTKTLQQSLSKKGLLAIAGHAGIGHVHGCESCADCVREGTGGFFTLAGLIAKALTIDITVAAVELNEPGTQILVRTKSGGEGVADFDQGFTPWEAKLMRQLVGMPPSAPQTMVQHVLGRISGQGSNPAGVVLCEAIAKAIMNSLYRANPERFLFEATDLPDSSGCFLGTVLDFDDIPVACLLSLDCCRNGVGPNEDAEDNVQTGAKRRLMEKLGMDQAPCIFLGSKSYMPEVSRHIEEVHFLIQWNKDHDNSVVARCLETTARSLGYKVLVAGRECSGGLAERIKARQRIGREIVRISQDFAMSGKAHEKIRLAALLADKVAKDMGRAALMSDETSNELDKPVKGDGGLWPGCGAVITLIVPEAYIKYWKIPAVIEADINNGFQILYRAIPLLWQNRDEARAVYEQRKSVDGFSDSADISTRLDSEGLSEGAHS